MAKINAVDRTMYIITSRLALFILSRQITQTLPARENRICFAWVRLCVNRPLFLFVKRVDETTLVEFFNKAKIDELLRLG
jgi:hypothetical protein